MRRVLLILGLLSGLAVPSAAQTAIPTNHLAFDQAAADLPTAQAYTYKLYADGATTGTAVASVTCSGTASPFTCQAPFPAFTPGPHSLTVTASNAAGESLPSVVLTFTFVVQPSPPQRPRIAP